MRIKAPYARQTIYSANLYQIFACAKNWPAKPCESVVGMLLHAGTDGEVQPDNDCQINGNTIRVKTLNLDQDFAEIKKKTGETAAAVEPPGKRIAESVV